MFFGCQSDWPDMLRYARKLGVIDTYFNEKAIVRMRTVPNRTQPGCTWEHDAPQVHEFPQSHCSDYREGTLFS